MINTPTSYSCIVASSIVMSKLYGVPTWPGLFSPCASLLSRETQIKVSVVVIITHSDEITVSPYRMTPMDDILLQISQQDNVVRSNLIQSIASSATWMVFPAAVRTLSK